MTDSIGTTIGSTSSSLLRRVRTRDSEAWGRLVRIYGPLVSFWLRRAGLQPADATDDVFQEIFRAVADGIDSFRKDHPSDTFRGWLRIITRSKVADHFRHAESQPMAEGGSAAYRRLQEAEDQSQDNDDSDESEVNVVGQLRRQAMELVRAEFEPRTWEMFWRTTVEEQAAKDVAADMGVSSAMVRLAKFRVLHRLREELEGLEEF